MIKAQLDPDSKQFIDWSMKYLSDELLYRHICREAVILFEQYLRQDREIIKKRLREKLTQGAIEHGSPLKYTQEEVFREVTKEHDDLLGWPLIWKHIESKK